MAMTPRQRFVAVYGAIAFVAAAGVFELAITHRTYAPFVWQFSWPYLDNWRNSTSRHHHELNVFYIARKIYALGAFALLGCIVAPILPPAKRIRYATIAVMALSALIELAQARHGRVESYASNAFDIASGALGGAIGGLAYDAGTRLLRRVRNR